ncbi:heme-binding protein [Acinetobacter sp. RF15A]|uniref:ABC transporter substrate-binding protein n=1 Tax=unclassified Acinetobacter TaxID=196816 RepID=UPI00119412F2|nr:MULTISPECIES: ABC transporter substrate-binding protein [unclassified Acinetobacter]TSH73873.1 heme-binding protein [Acinetobacter sp. RF15A]TSI17161.1 heme-binding protein [Acinetobacter sp. RF15B]
MLKEKFLTPFLQLTRCLIVSCLFATAALPVGAANPADPNKILRDVFPVAETGFDPAATHDVYSGRVNAAIFENLFSYDYLASPVKLVPNTAVALPQVSADGLTYTIQIKKGIYFADDPVFKGKKRELTAADYAYSLKRLIDPTLHSPNSWLLEGRIKGTEALLAQAKKTGKFDYDRPFEGIQTPDRYTLILKLIKPDQNFAMLLAHQPAAAVAREVIEKYRNKAGFVMDHPVGTGPYLLSHWTPASRIILTANPNYRGFVWNFKASHHADQPIIKAMQGKKMPQIGTIDIRVIEEAQSRWLAFSKNELDISEIEGDLVVQALENGVLKPNLKKQGIQLSRISDPLIGYQYWNMRHPVVGGLAKEKIALRRAMAMAFSTEKMINILYKGDATQLQMPIPPGMVGYSPQYKSSIPYSVKAANLLLDRYQYQVGTDGWRRQPNGKPLEIELIVGNTSRGQQQAEFWKKALDSIQIKMVSKAMPFAEALKLEKQCKTMFKGSAWIADYPDADNFMQLFYGKNIHMTNNSCFRHPEFDRLYEQTQSMNPGPERDALYRKMSRILEVNMPVLMLYSSYRNVLTQARVIGYKNHPILSAEWMYLDVDSKK